MFGGALYNHLVGADEERGRNGNPQRLRRFEVEGQFERCGLFDRQIAGQDALQNLVDIGRRATKQDDQTWAIGHEASGRDVIARGVEGGYARRGRIRP